MRKKNKIDKDICFKDEIGNLHLLFHLLNIGSKTQDELKFIFSPDNPLPTGSYLTEGNTINNDEIIYKYVEITYHNDGALLIKFCKTLESDKPFYKNPNGNGIKRKPLALISEFEPIIGCNVFDYKYCVQVPESNQITIPYNPIILNGDPFEFIVFIGSYLYANPPNNLPTEIIFRVNDIGINLDLIIWLFKSNKSNECLLLEEMKTEVITKTKSIWLCNSEKRI